MIRSAKSDIRDLDAIRSAIYRDQKKSTPAVFLDACGSLSELGKSNIPRKTKEFYDTFYAKSKVVVVVKGKKDALAKDEVMRVLQSFEEKSEMKVKVFVPPVSRGWNIPELKKNYFVFTQSDLRPRLKYYVWFVATSAHQDTLTFISQVLEDLLLEILIKKKRLAEMVEVDCSFLTDIVQLSIVVDLTRKGRSNPSLVILSLKEIISGLEEYNTESDFENWSKSLRIEYLLSPLGDDWIDLITGIANNYARLGITRILGGTSFPRKYDKKDTALYIETIEHSSFVVVYNNQFEVEECGDNNLLAFFKSDVSFDDKYGTQKESSKIAYCLDKEAKLPGNSFASFSIGAIATLKLLNHFNNPDLDLEDIYFNPRNYEASETFVESLRQHEPSQKLELVKPDQFAPKYFSYMVSDRFKIKMSVVFAVFNLDLEATKETANWMKYYSTILNRRAKMYTLQLEKYRHEISFETNSLGMILKVAFLSDNAEYLLEVGLREIFLEEIHEDEHLFALDSLYEVRLDKETDLYEKANHLAIKSFYPYIAGPDDQIDFVKTLYLSKKWPKKLPEFFIGWTHVHQAEVGFNQSRLLDTLSSHPEGLKGIGNATVVKMQPKVFLFVKEGFQTGEPENVLAYTSCHLLGIGSPENSVMADLLSEILSNLAYDELRTKENIGYIVLFDKLEARKELYTCLTIQSEKDEDFVQKKAEEFYKKAETYLHTLDEAVLHSILTDQITKSSHKQEDMEEEAEFWFYTFYAGLDESFMEKKKRILSVTTTSTLYSYYIEKYKVNPIRIIAEAVHPSKTTTGFQIESPDIYPQDATITTLQ